MLPSVLGDYLDRLPSERAFDVPFQALLRAMGFFDIHLVHGKNEMGKDFIAKRLVDGIQFQWTFQSKRGDIKLGEWRKEILGQMLACESTGLQHPNFDPKLARQSVLVLTGTLAESVAGEITSFSEVTLRPIGKNPIEVWSKPRLQDLLEEYGLSAVQATLATGSKRFGPFYTIYGRAVSGELLIEDLENYSRSWLDSETPAAQLLLAGSVEAAMLAEQCRTTMSAYEALHCELTALRTICVYWFRNNDAAAEQFFRDLHGAQLEKIHSTCLEFVDAVMATRINHERHLDRAIRSPAIIVTYPVICMRAIEVAALGFAIELNEEQRSNLARFIEELVLDEPGSWHPISDRYAVSIVFACLTLVATKSDAARKLLVNTTVFLADAYQKGYGLAGVDATVDDEVQQLLGYPFTAFEVAKESSSLIATALCDLAAFYGDAQLYEDIVNDVKAARIYPQCWQCRDTEGQFEIDAEDVIQYSSIEFEDNLSPFQELNYAQHVRKEPRSFFRQKERGFASFVAISLLLRDRYFPSVWMPRQAVSAVRSQ